ncbi:MAG TPA: hypothetical protein DCX95_02840 [Elusimicrobia bacterium]|nr:hypothetical protein [Elusimicrobiota bacterium]
MTKKIIYFWVLFFIATSVVIAGTLNDALLESQNFNHKKSLKILKKLPPSENVLRHLAWAHLKVGNFYEASEIFSTLNQSDYEILFGLGLSYFLQEDYESSEAYFKKCLAVNKNIASAEYFCGEIKNIQGFTDDAVKHYKNVLKLDSHFVDARLKLARRYFDTKKYDDSFREWSKILNIDPKSKEGQASKETLLALITKKPEEIVPPKRIAEGTAVAPAPLAEKIPVLRIGILKIAKEINLWSESGLEIIEENKVIFTTPPREVFSVNGSSEIFKGKKIVVKPKSNKPDHSTIIIRDVKYAEGFPWAGIADMEYRGYFEIVKSPPGFSLINIVNLEEYLYSVLPSEMTSWWPEEALKTQAVVARSEALYRKNISRPHGKDNFDLCSEQHCQVYSGVKQETDSAKKAVNSTRGEILEYNGKPAHTLYSSNCSGHTQSSKELKNWSDVPYWQGVPCGDILPPVNSAELDRWLKHPPDIFCAPSKYTYYAESRWMRVVEQKDLADWLNRNYKLGGIKKIIPLKRSPSGHINHIRVEGTKGNADIEKENLIRGLTFGRLRSTNFIVECYGKSGGLPKYFIFWGAGWGHAVGLCQSGAAGMAEKKYAYPDILKKYYKDTYLKKMDY